MFQALFGPRLIASQSLKDNASVIQIVIVSDTIHVLRAYSIQNKGNVTLVFPRVLKSSTFFDCLSVQIWIQNIEDKEC